MSVHNTWLGTCVCMNTHLITDVWSVCSTPVISNDKHDEGMDQKCDYGFVT